MKRDGKFMRGASEDNAARGHQLKTGLHGGCFLSFTRSAAVAARFATKGNSINGFVYVVNEVLLPRYGIVVKEFADPEFADEVEVSLRGRDNGELPRQIVVAKYEVTPKYV